MQLDTSTVAAAEETFMTMTLNGDDMIWSVEDVFVFSRICSSLHVTTLQTNVCVVVIYFLNKTGNCDMKEGRNNPITCSVLSLKQSLFHDKTAGW